MKFSIVVTTFNRAELTKNCVGNSIINAGRPFELVWVDNASTDNVRDVMKRFAPTISILRETNGGMAVSTNDAWKVATGDYIIGIASDFLMPENWLLTIEHYLERIPETDVILMAWKDFDHHKWQGKEKVINGLKVEIANKMIGVVCFSRKIFDKVGYLDERLGWYGSTDTDWSNRVKRVGKLFYYIPDVRVIHYWNVGTSKDYPSDRAFKDKACEMNPKILAKKYKVDNSIYYTPFNKDGTRKKEKSFAPKALQHYENSSVRP